MTTTPAPGDLKARLPSIETLMQRLAAADPVFDQWRNGVPDKHWATKDLSALRIGYELGRSIAALSALPAASEAAMRRLCDLAQDVDLLATPENPRASEIASAIIECIGAIRRDTTPAPVAASGECYQDRVGKWMDECFPRALYGDMTQRCDRFLEEALELLQSLGYDRSRVATLVDYVWGRPVGEPKQEVGGTVVTLAALCWVAGIDMHGEAARELARIEQPEVMAKIRAKQEAKNALHFDSPLPGPTPPPAAESKCGTCGDAIKPDVMTGTTCRCAAPPAAVGAQGDGFRAALEQIAAETSASDATEAADRFQRIAREALTASPAAGRGDGMVLVPREPTDAMVDMALALQGEDAFMAKAHALVSALRKIYKAMLTAASDAGGAA